MRDHPGCQINNIADRLDWTSWSCKGWRKTGVNWENSQPTPAVYRPRDEKRERRGREFHFSFSWPTSKPCTASYYYRISPKHHPSRGRSSGRPTALENECFAVCGDKSSHLHTTRPAVVSYASLPGGVGEAWSIQIIRRQSLPDSRVLSFLGVIRAPCCFRPDYYSTRT